MGMEALRAKLADPAFRAALEAATPEARAGILAAAGLDVTPAEVEAALAGELSETELDEVAGGDPIVVRYPYPPPSPTP